MISCKRPQSVADAAKLLIDLTNFGQIAPSLPIQHEPAFPVVGSLPRHHVRAGAEARRSHRSGEKARRNEIS